MPKNNKSNKKEIKKETKKNFPKTTSPQKKKSSFKLSKGAKNLIFVIFGIILLYCVLTLLERYRVRNIHPFDNFNKRTESPEVKDAIEKNLMIIKQSIMEGNPVDLYYAAKHLAYLENNSTRSLYYLFHSYHDLNAVERGIEFLEQVYFLIYAFILYLKLFVPYFFLFYDIFVLLK